MAVLSLSDPLLSPHPLFSKAEGCSYNILKLINFSRPPFPMCFLKHVKNISQGPLYSSPQGKPQKSQSDTENLSSQEMLSNFECKSQPLPIFDSNYFLMNCLGLMNFNSQILKNLDQKLLSTELSLADSFSCLEESTLENSQNGLKRKTGFTQNIPEKVEQNLHEATNPLTQQLFGHQHYRYRLELAREFADVLYKERNFSIAVKLVEISSGKQKRNGNLINLCVSVCDKEGEWINETKEGVAFIKGKVETQLYHGQGEFCKLAPKDVSRAFTDKTVNLVVYCKPSLLKYSGETTLEENIDYRMIEPLIIKDISIKAKKRQ